MILNLNRVDKPSKFEEGRTVYLGPLMVNTSPFHLPEVTTVLLVYTILEIIAFDTFHLRLIMMVPQLGPQIVNNWLLSGHQVKEGFFPLLLAVLLCHGPFGYMI